MNPTEIHHVEPGQRAFVLRARAMALCVLAAFGVLAWRLYVLQVQRHDDLAGRAESNRTAVVPLVPMRGQIVDRNGVVLATNEATWTLEMVPGRVPRGQRDATLDALAQVLDISARERRRFLRLVQDSPRFASIPIRSRLSDEEVARFAARRWRFAGVQLRARLYRSYPMQDGASHVIGHVGRINQEEKERIDDSPDAANYRGTEIIGKTGIEQSYEAWLHGQTGRQALETSAGGNAMRLLGQRAPTPGSTLVLTLDMKLQHLVEQMYGARRGALVALDPRSGQVLAMVSRPGFDPNLFVDGIDHESWAQLNESPHHPLLHRALRGTYPPGSTYKPFMALAGLESGKRTPQSTIMDHGSWTLGGNVFRSGRALGATDLRRSIVQSSNVYYYALGHEMGADLIHRHMEPLGFGRATGLDLKGEASGLLPSTQWKLRASGGRQAWVAGDDVSLGIGQGYNNFTILQLAHATATLAAGGMQHRPHLVMGRGQAAMEGMDGGLRFVDWPRPAGKHLGYQAHNVQAVREAMAAVPKEGTARAIFAGAPYASAGKTGTAQAVGVRQNERYNAARLSEFQRDHSLYIAWAPADEPVIALAAIVENAGFGSRAAAPLARRVFDFWLLGHWPNEQDMQAMREGRAGAPTGEPLRASDVPLPNAEMLAIEGLPQGGSRQDGSPKNALHTAGAAP